MEGCVSVLCTGGQGANGKSRGVLFVCHQFSAVLSSTPPSMLIKAPQIRSREREKERVHTHIFVNECRIQAERRDTVHAKMCTGVFTTSTLDHFLTNTVKLKVLNYGVPSIFVENYRSL